MQKKGTKFVCKCDVAECGIILKLDVEGEGFQPKDCDCPIFVRNDKMKEPNWKQQRRSDAPRDESAKASEDDG